MSSHVVSFRATDFDPARTKSVLNAYLEYERARAVRQMLVVRLLLFLLVAVALTWVLPVLPIAGFAIVCALAAAVAGSALVREVRIRRRFAHESGLS